MSDRSTVSRFPTGEVARVMARLAAFGLPAEARLDARARERLATLVEASAADARPPLDSPHRWRRFAARPLKLALRKAVWSRTGPALERQAEFNAALIRVAAELLSSGSRRWAPPGARGVPGPARDG